MISPSGFSGQTSAFWTYSWGVTPQMGRGHRLSSRAPSPLGQCIGGFGDAYIVDWIAGGLDEHFDCGGRFRMAEQKPVDALRQNLFDHPGVSPHHILVGAVGGQRADDRRSSVSTSCCARIS